MTIAEFRRDPQRRLEWAKVCQSQIFKDAMTVTHDDGPQFAGKPLERSLSDVDSHIRHGFILGYANRQLVLENLQFTVQEIKELEATYADPKD